jgi:coenzyme Q-binding protein COQ10
MALHKEQRRLYYSPRQLFELVAQVERYPEFLPLWQDVRVSKVQQNNSEHPVYFTDQRIQLGPIYKSFRTQTTLIPFHSIHIVSSDPMFRKFAIDWFFKAEKEGGCKIQFTLDCIASSVLLRPVFDITLLEAAKSIVTAFEKRAGFIYGRLS